MSDWQVGDMAVCINDAPCHCGCYIAELRKGNVLRVSAVLSSPHEGVGLCFEEIDAGSGHSAFGSRRFRKIEPDKHEADETCPALLKLSKQRVKA